MKVDKLEAIIIGDSVNAPYHPFPPVETFFREALEKDFNLTVTEDREMLKKDSIKAYDLCISYVDTWKGKLTEEQIGGLLSFVAEGGNLLVVHNGIAFQSNREYAQLVQGKFVGHPPYQELQFNIKEKDHPVTKGINDFVMNEELYTFELDKLFDAEVLIECTNGELTQPALWVHKYGLGRVVYLAPGHSRESFENPNLVELIKRSALWAVNKL